MSLSIKKYAEAGGVGVETVRFYQRKGLLDTPEKGGGIRHYDAADVSRLRFIRMAQQAGFTLEEIRELLALDSGQDRQRARELALARIAKLDKQIVEMERARDYLQKLARQCTVKRSGPCPILASFDG
ncbi:MerR family transcriptional regulator [Pseudoxanthomonas mexicana]|uniref:MerR family transcriptional regulator n=1 Tax=Pseudoxanthomonas mexicana TaxID=128785 RepID=UPI0022F3BD4B|nr:MerR family transcriptional regulator [Pseudoxanthomonas mexicana]WBX93139.1 MerR family DNA-binding protein [Pseudoxanthomonas mexicana]